MGEMVQKYFKYETFLSLTMVSPWTISFNESKVSWGYQDAKFPLSQLEQPTRLA